MLRREIASAKGVYGDSKSVFIQNHQGRDEANIHNEALHWDIQKNKYEFDECNHKNQALIT